MIDDCKYNKCKLLHELSRLSWFIKKHALHDAEKANEKACLALLQELQKDLERHIASFNKMS